MPKRLAAFALVAATLASCTSNEGDSTPTVQIIGASGSSGASGTSGATGGKADGGSAGTAGSGGTIASAGNGGSPAGSGGASGQGVGGVEGGGSGQSGGGASGTGGTAGNASVGGTGGTSGSSGSAGGPDVCAGVASASFEPPTVCDGPAGNTSTQIPSNHVYATSWFGCYAKPDGTIVQDPSDNCEFACGSKGLCPSTQTGPECEAGLKWFAADADRYGCGSRIRLTNCANGKAVVVATLDRGPNCNNEMSYGVSVIDMSHDAMIYLFDGQTYGGSDKKRIEVEKVDPSTPLGPVM